MTRSLNEPIPLIKTEDRLSRNLDDRDFTGPINNHICRLGNRHVSDDMVIAIDPGDIRKNHASKMECLCRIHDGSENEIGDGYWLAKAVAADIEHKKVIPSTSKHILKKQKTSKARTISYSKSSIR